MSKVKKFTAPFADQNEFQGSDFQAPLIDVLERKVRFSLRNCDIGKKYCISTVSVDKVVLSDLYKRLGHLEDMTWNDIQSIPHKNGISIEKKNSSNHKELAGISGNEFDTFGHFRVSSAKKSTFRVFGAIKNDLFYILRFDVDGSVNHN